MQAPLRQLHQVSHTDADSATRFRLTAGGDAVPWKLYGDGSFYNVAADVDEKSSLSSSAAPEAHARLKQTLESMPEKGQKLLQFD